MYYNLLHGHCLTSVIITLLDYLGLLGWGIFPYDHLSSLSRLTSCPRHELLTEPEQFSEQLISDLWLIIQILYSAGCYGFYFIVEHEIHNDVGLCMFLNVLIYVIASDKSPNRLGPIQGGLTRYF